MKTIIFFAGFFCLFSTQTFATCNPNGATPTIELSETGLAGLNQVSETLAAGGIKLIGKNREDVNRPVAQDHNPLAKGGQKNISTYVESLPAIARMEAYDDYGNLMKICNAFLADNSKGKSTMITAGHCFKESGFVGKVVLRFGQNPKDSDTVVEIDIRKMKDGVDYVQHYDEAGLTEHAFFNLPIALDHIKPIKMLPTNLVFARDRIKDSAFVGFHGDVRGKEGEQVVASLDGIAETATVQRSTKLDYLNLNPIQRRKLAAGTHKDAHKKIITQDDFYAYPSVSGAPLLRVDENPATGQLTEYIEGMVITTLNGSTAKKAKFVTADYLRPKLHSFIAKK